MIPLETFTFIEALQIRKICDHIMTAETERNEGEEDEQEERDET
jgi:hypothetical protein